MKKPVFAHCNTLFTISWILTVPLLVNICTCCNLFSFWLSWILFALILVISIIRLVFGFRQKCYKFSWGLIGELILGAAVLLFFQLSFNKVIDTPVSDPRGKAAIAIQAPEALKPDTADIHKHMQKTHTEKEERNSHR